MRAELGLDQPPLTRFLDVFTNLITLDFGVTIMTREPVLDSIWHPLLNSLLMTSVAVVVTPIVAIVLGMLAALRPGGRVDDLVSGGTWFAYSMPDFVVGNIFIIVFALQLGAAVAAAQ